MRKVTGKILIAAFFIMIIASTIPRIMFDISERRNQELEISPTLFLIGGFTSVFIAIMLFSLFMDRIVMKRIKQLNEATSEVINGNYDFTLEMSQKDEISALTNNFNRMVKELQSNEYLNKEFVRNMSHEIKTPLSAINGYAELMINTKLSETEVKEYATIISSEAKRLSLLAKDILLVSLVESQSILQNSELFKASEQIRNVLQLMQLSWEGKNIEFDLELDSVKVFSNKEITYQIWTNLISNAIKFSPKDATIKITLKEIDDSIEFIITNPGTISAIDQEKVFQLFYVGDKTNNRDNNGVGLTLISKIIDKLNGSINLTSLDDLVTFTVSIPTNKKAQ